MSDLRVAILGAFRFPAPRGSQAYAREQADALVRAGVDVTVVSYGGDTNPRELGFTTRTIAPPLRPRSDRSGFHAAKPFADMALALRLRAQHRKRPFDVVLAHNAEAALVARLARKLGGPPVVVYGSARRWQEVEFKANLQAFFLVTGSFLVITRFINGTFTPVVWRNFAIATPAVLLGLAAGFSLDRYLDTERFRRLVLLLLVVLGFYLLFS